ncbi:MAG: DUF5050 domain-containing protein [Clostridia bacterium]|nr:DUF5050 domain-containing protein [Clostridia bacterium]
MGEVLSGNCPYCKRRLEYEKGAETVYCYACERSVDVALIGKGSAAAEITPTVAAPMIAGFDNPESGVVFIENFFETYDWSEYKETEELAVKEIADVVQSNKIKNGAVGQSWYLDFKALSVPLAKKFEGIAEKAKAIADKYNPYDTANCYQEFDVYRKLIKLLIDNKDAIGVRLETAVKYAEKYKLESSKLADMKKDLKDIKAALAGLKEVETINDVPEYAAAKDKFNKQKEREYAEQGIDARSVYAEAVALFEAGQSHMDQALALFESIRGYSDTIEYISKINEYFVFDDLFRFYGKYFIYKKESYAMSTLDVGNIGKKKKKKKKNAEDDPTVVALSLYEVVNGVPSDQPTVKGIEKFVTCYNSKYYYFKKNMGLFCFDLANGTEVCVLQGKSADFTEKGVFQYREVLNGTHVAVKRKLKPHAKLGCFGRSKKKKAEDIVLNNYCLELVELRTNQSKVVINEMVDIADRYDKEIFYIYAENLGEGHRHRKKDPMVVNYRSMLKVCDLATGENSNVLNEGCEIHTVVDKKIVYSLWKPNELNKDLHVYDMVSGEDVLIEDNIYRYYAVIDGKVYYTVGNEFYEPLVRKNLDGTERKEIMKEIEYIVGIRAGWLYVKKGYGKNALLVKVSADGETRIVVCTQFKEIVSFSASHVHYVDTSGNFRVVRSDGKENTLIAQEIEKAIVENDDDLTYAVIDDKNLYYVRSEYVESDDSEAAYSLYKMDNDGHNVRKLVFNVDSVSAYDKNKLYFVKSEYLRYKVITPLKKGKTKERYETFYVTRYFEFDKATEKHELVLTLGLPEEKNVKKGCFKKKKKDGTIYEEAPVERSFRRKGLAGVGMIEDEEQQKKAEEIAAAKDGRKAKKGCGCMGKKKKAKKVKPVKESAQAPARRRGGCSKKR